MSGKKERAKERRERRLQEISQLRTIPYSDNQRYFLFSLILAIPRLVFQQIRGNKEYFCTFGHIMALNGIVFLRYVLLITANVSAFSSIIILKLLLLVCLLIF